MLQMLDQHHISIIIIIIPQDRAPNRPLEGPHGTILQGRDEPPGITLIIINHYLAILAFRIDLPCITIMKYEGRNKLARLFFYTKTFDKID